MTPEQCEEVQNQLGRLANLFAKTNSEILEKYGDVQNTFRHVLFSATVNALNSAYLALKFQTDYLYHEVWWNGYRPDVGLNDRLIFNIEYNNFARLSLLHFTFSTIENGLRTVARGLNSCNNGTAEFKSIYSSILKYLNLQQHESLFDLLRHVRNSIHNNGVYFHKSNTDETVVHKGKSYVFEIGKPFLFATWDFYFEHLNELHDVLREIVFHEKLITLPSLDNVWNSTEKPPAEIFYEKIKESQVTFNYVLKKDN